MCGDKNMCGGGEMSCGSGDMHKSCGMCGGHSRSFLKKVLMMLIIVIISFWAGLKLGEISGFIRASGGGNGYKMMRANGWSNVSVDDLTAPTAPEATQ